MTGPNQPTPPGPSGPARRTYWARPEDDPASPGPLVRRGWRLYRSAPGGLLLIAAITGSLQTLLALPSLATAVALAQRTFDVLADYFNRVVANPEAYRYADQQALQAELEAKLRSVMVPATDLAPLTAAGAGLGVAVGLVGTAALTAMALSIAAGRPIPAGFAFRLVAARAGLVRPIVALGLGWMVVTWLSLTLQASPDIQAWAGAPGSPRSVLIGSLLSVLAVVVFVGIIVVAVRWALFIPAVLVEALGVGAGLARAAVLSRGIRIRLGLAMVGIALIGALLVGVLGTVAGVAVGLSAQSFGAGFAVYMAAGLIGNVLLAPWLPSMFAVAYRDRTVGAPSPGIGSRTEPTEP